MLAILFLKLCKPVKSLDLGSLLLCSIQCFVSLIFLLLNFEFKVLIVNHYGCCSIVSKSLLCYDASKVIKTIESKLGSALIQTK